MTVLILAEPSLIILEMSNIAFVLLAAGSSSRLGRAKQLLTWKGKSLLEHRLEQSEGLDLSFRLLVYGARKSTIEGHLVGLKIPLVYNPDWANGMGSSIQTGVQEALSLEPDLEAVLLCLVDQPLVNQAHFASLIELHKAHPTSIIAASYQNVLGVPAIFPKAFFPDLMTLQEQAGAKKIIKKYQNQVIPFPCPEAAFDIDTEADYTHLLKK